MEIKNKNCSYEIEQPEIEIKIYNDFIHILNNNIDLEFDEAIEIMGKTYNNLELLINYFYDVRKQIQKLKEADIKYDFDYDLVDLITDELNDFIKDNIFDNQNQQFNIYDNYIENGYNNILISDFFKRVNELIELIDSIIKY